MSRTMTVTWRDESYGRFSGAKSAFRLYNTGDLIDAEFGNLHAAATKAGFRWEDSRGAWIARDAEARGRYIAGLEALGFTVEHAGCWRGPEDELASPSISEGR